MDFCSRKTTTSTKYEGVSYTLNKMSLGRRIQYQETVQEALAQWRELQEQAESLTGEGPAEKKQREQLRAQQALIIRKRIDHPLLMWGLHRIDNLTIDGQPATPELLYSDGPEDLVDEILQAIRAQMEMSPDEQKN